MTWKNGSSPGCPTAPGCTRDTARTPPSAPSGRTWRSGAPVAGDGQAGVTEQREYVVVGAGLLGLSAAAALARRGRDVVVLEQAFPGHPAGGSKGICRLGYADPAYVALARLARESWASLEDSVGRRLLLPAPHLTVGSGLSAVQAAMLAAGAPCELLGRAEAEARFPALMLPGPALLEEASCVIDASAALRALASLVPDLR